MDGLAGRRSAAPRSTTTTASKSFEMKPATAHDRPCEGGEMSKEQQAVVDRYREQQAAKGVAKSSSVARELEKCPVAQQDDTDYKSSEEASHFNFNYQASNMSLTNFDSFPLMTDFSAGNDALKWTDLEQNVVYQIINLLTVNTSHGQSVILSLQKADGSSCSAWACGMLSTELIQNPMVMVSSRMFVLATGKKTSKNGESTIRISR